MIYRTTYWTKPANMLNADDTTRFFKHVEPKGHKSMVALVILVKDMFVCTV